MRWIDMEALKRDRPVEEVVERYGIELCPGGRALVGRCPFHDDGGRPNLYVYAGTQSWFCYRCNVGGDVISFVERIEGVGFRDAVVRLTGDRMAVHGAAKRPTMRRKSRPVFRMAWGPDERACLRAAVELYHNRLLNDPAPLAYLRSRGVDRDIIERCRIGYVAGKELAAYLQWRGLPIGAAMRVGLLRKGGREFLSGRVVVPEIRGGQPIWLIGRTIDPNDERPKYLGLPGRKPLLGWEMAKDAREVFLVEGVFDWLTLLGWGYPALALVGTRAPSHVLNALAGFRRVSVVFDSDEAGQVAAVSVVNALAGRATIVRLPGIKDVAELAVQPNGRDTFRHIRHQFDSAA